MFASRPLLAVFGCAIVYTFGALCAKRALSAGATVWQVNFAANMAMSVLFLPFWFGADVTGMLTDSYKPILAAGAFFTGQLFTFCSPSPRRRLRSDPPAGAKVIFVAFITSFLFGDPVGVKWWVAAAICTCGIFLVTGAQPRTEAWRRHSARPPSIR